MSWSTIIDKIFKPFVSDVDSVLGRPLTFREFVDLVNPYYRWYRHNIALAEVVQKVADGVPTMEPYGPNGELVEVTWKRVMVFMPPRHGKSEAVSRLASAYFLYRYPAKWVAITSYGQDLANKLSRTARDNFRRAGGKLNPYAWAVKEWQTEAGGGLWCAGIGGSSTGKGFHYGIIDDPFKGAEDSSSAPIREKKKDWYRAVFYTRAEGGMAEPGQEVKAVDDEVIFIIQTRWHEEDIAGWQLAEELSECIEDDGTPERWHIVSMPAIAEEEIEVFPDSCTVEPDWRKPGEALWPEKYPFAKLQRMLRKIGAYFWAALYQQRPAPREGSFFDVAKIEFVKVAPAGLASCRAWDMGASPDPDADETAGSKLSGPDKEGFYYLLDCVHGRWNTAGRDAVIKLTAGRDGYTVPQCGPVDPGAAGLTAYAWFTKLLAGWPLRAAKTDKKKVMRADGYSSQVNAGNVKMVIGAWNKHVIDQMRQFPNGGHDDVIDSMADAFNQLSQVVTGQGKSGGGDRSLPKSAEDNRMPKPLARS